MLYKRRDFIKTTAAGLAITAVSSSMLSCSSTSGAKSKNSIGEFGLQLYTLRDVIPQDPKGILKQVADMGYKQIESYEHDKLGFYWGMKNTEFKKYMDDLGMKIVSTHCNINNDFERKAEEAAEIGMKYLICPGLGNEGGMNKDEYLKTAALFNQKGQVCKSKGIRFAYHNHDQTFKTRESGFNAQELLLQNTDPALVDYEMDIYWVVTGGQDPITWLKKYPNRFKLVHVKDRKKDAPLTEREASVNVGEGSIDFKSVLKVAKETGVEYYIVEQEKYENSTPLLAAKADADYLKQFTF
jgi:sugar phosphate isomerase/epimerase